MYNHFTTVKHKISGPGEDFILLKLRKEILMFDVIGMRSVEMMEGVQMIGRKAEEEGLEATSLIRCWCWWRCWWWRWWAVAGRRRRAARVLAPTTHGIQACSKLLLVPSHRWFNL